jgi:hypothetical protein
MTFASTSRFRHLACFVAFLVVTTALVLVPTPVEVQAQSEVEWSPDGANWYQDLYEVCDDVLGIPVAALGTFTSGSSGVSLGYVLTGGSLTLAPAAGTAGAGATAAVATGGTGALAAITAGGAFCGTLVSLENAQFALGMLNPTPGPTASLTLPGNTSGLQQCSTYEVATVQSTDRCVFIAIPGALNGGSTRFSISANTSNPDKGGMTATTGSSPMVPAWREGTYQSISIPFNQNGLVESSSENKQQYHFPKPPGYVGGIDGVGWVIRLDCDDDPTCRLATGTKISLRDVVSPYVTRAEWLLDLNVQERGQRREAFFTQRCKIPGGVTTERTIWSGPFWEADGVPSDFTKPLCETGKAEIYWQSGTRRVGRSTEIWPLRIDNEWSLPSNVANNSQSLACFIVGVTVCPMWSDSAESPTVRLGGPGGVEYPKTTPRVDTLLPELDDPIRDLIPPANPNPTTVPTTTPNTTAVPTTTPPPTSVPPGDPIPPQDPPPPPPPPEDGDSQWSTCMEDQVDSDWGEVTYNPVTWVRALIYYFTAPIICALWWLFVPSGGFGPLWDDIMAMVDDSDLLQPVQTFMSSISVSEGGCAPVPMGTIMGVTIGDVDVGMCQFVLLQFVWTIILGFAVLSMFRSVYSRFVAYGARRSTPADGDDF